MPMYMNTQIDIFENMIRAMITPAGKSYDSNVRDFFTALHNAFSYGEIVPEVEKEDLQEIYKHFEALNKIVSKYE